MTDDLHTWGFDPRENVYHARGCYDTYCGAPMRSLRGNMLATVDQIRRLARPSGAAVCKRCLKNIGNKDLE